MKDQMSPTVLIIICLSNTSCIFVWLDVNRPRKINATCVTYTGLKGKMRGGGAC